MSKAIIKSPDPKKEETTPPKKRKRITVKELVDRHMKDKNHIITNEEISDLDLDLGHPETGTSHTPDRSKEEDKDPKIIAPRDTIN